MSDMDQHWMRHALRLAERGWGTTHPNPMVGCAIVKNDQIVSEGWHEVAGGAHAEKMAIQNSDSASLEGATLYVTLEPCSTVGRTGACVDLILKTGISRVVMATVDPNPLHQGKAVELLRSSGREVVVGCCEEEARRLNWIFNHQIVHRQPFVAAKTAVTLDGKIATRTGHSQWITGEQARQDVMRWRALFPVIAVGAGTVVADNPSLTIRQSGKPTRCARRLILDRSGILAGKWQEYATFTDEYAESTIWLTTESVKEKWAREVSSYRSSVWSVSDACAASPVLLWQEILRRVWDQGWTGIWVEGGGNVMSGLLSSGQLHALWYYQSALFLADAQAPGWIAGATPLRLENGYRLIDIDRDFWGTDSVIRGLVCYPQ
jgi:diaminohydroxyphosphoribosylaminopyrimidine deaminase/5-amino-6-(5-phosphoribosylamino)uracil reductase